MDKINFGIDGWWGKIAKDFTQHNVALVANGIAKWLTSKFGRASVVLGSDTRFGGDLFIEAVAKIIASKGIKVYLAENYVTSPMVSLATVKLNAQCGIVITASHNAAEYNGIRIKGEHGGPLLITDVENIQNLITTDYSFDLEMLNWNYFLEKGNIQYVSIQSIYQKNIIDYYDIEAIKTSPLQFGFDAMYGGSQFVMQKIFPQIKFFHCRVDPLFGGIKPDPVERNLHEMAAHIEQFKDIDSAIAVDADGDRLAMLDENGHYISGHQLFLLVIHYLVKYEQQSGKVLAGFAMTSAVEKLCSHYGVTVERTKFGFSHLAEIMLKDEILCAGEETGGLALGSYLPERDGLWVGIQIWEWLAKSEKKISELVDEVEAITGTFACDKTVLIFNRTERGKIMEKCRNGQITKFGSNLVTKTEDLDGYKFFFGDNAWVLLRSSSRHPIIRLYAEADTPSRVTALIQTVKTQLENEVR